MPRTRFGRRIEHYLPQTRVLHPYPHQRFASRVKAGAVCGSGARTDLCGGRGVIPVPTATGGLAKTKLIGQAKLTGQALLCFATNNLVCMGSIGGWWDAHHA